MLGSPLPRSLIWIGSDRIGQDWIGIARRMEEASAHSYRSVLSRLCVTRGIVLSAAATAAASTAASLLLLAAAAAPIAVVAVQPTLALLA